MSEAGPSKQGWHSLTIQIPFLTPTHAEVAKQSLQVDREQNATFVERELSISGSILVVNYSATTVRLLRLATNSFLSSVDLVMRTMQAFAPDPDKPDMTDEELERIRVEANRESGIGSGFGIELKGDGTGAGSGEEVR